VTDVWPTTVAALLELYERRGDEPYGEAVCQRAHALQCAALASEDGADDALVAAALLHDVGHLLAPPRLASWRDDVDDDRHEALGARALGALFGSTVTAPVALHVTAKRWRCATDPGYLSSRGDQVRGAPRVRGGGAAPHLGRRRQGPATPGRIAPRAPRAPRGARDAARLAAHATSTAAPCTRSWARSASATGASSSG